MRRIAATGHKRGHPIQYINGQWVYIDNGVPISQEERACARCGRMPTQEGYDACLGYIPRQPQLVAVTEWKRGMLFIKEQTTTIKQLSIGRKDISQFYDR